MTMRSPLLLSLLLAACATPAPDPLSRPQVPPPPMVDVMESRFFIDSADPYRWMEEPAREPEPNEPVASDELPAGEPGVPEEPSAGHEAGAPGYDEDPWLEEETPPEAPPAEPAEGEAGAEDVLEETPEFLQETPEHDRLWFEQRPPRDFDWDK